MDAAAYAGKRVLVTGGCGFIGSNLVIQLVALGADVTVVDSLLPGLGGNRFNLAPVEQDVRISDVDVRETDAVAELVRDRHVVFSLAGSVSHIDSMSDPITDLQVNCQSHLSLLEACRRVNPEAVVVFAASRQQYGRPRYLPLDENHPLAPIDVNGIHKAAAEAALLLYHRVYGIPVCSLRLINTYGPRMQMRHARHGFVNWFVRLALEGREIELFGDGSTLRDFNYVDDVVDAFLRAGLGAAAVGEVFNLGHPQPLSLREFADALFDAVGGGSARSVPFPEERARIAIGDVYCSWRKINEALGWEPTTPLREGLRRTVDYYRAHRDRYW